MSKTHINPKSKKNKAAKTKQVSKAQGNRKAAKKQTEHRNGRLSSLHSSPPHHLTIQRQVVVGKKNDPYEKEADIVAKTVTEGMSPSAISRAGSGKMAQRQVRNPAPTQSGPETSQPKGKGTPYLSKRTLSTLRQPGAGQPISPNVRRKIEPHVGTSLRHVRVHSDSNAARAATNLQARAFAHGHHIFLNRSESSQDLKLMAHEATHVVQQGAATAYRSTTGAAAPPNVQRLLPNFVMNGINDYARHIPGFTLFTVIIGFNPLTGNTIERNAMNLMEGLMGLVPFGTFIFDALRSHNILQPAFAWVENELSRLNLTMSRVEQVLENAWEDVRVAQGFDYNLQVLQRHFGHLYNDVKSFAASLVNHIVTLIKNAAIDITEEKLAENKAWSLIKKIIKVNPLTGEEVEATTVDILRDFLLLIGKEQELAQMEARGTLEETAVWLDTQLGTFLSLAGELNQLFSDAWQAIQPENLPNLTTNLQLLTAQVGRFLQRAWTFARTVAAKVLAFIKKALLNWLSAFANDIPGYHLLTVILEKDIFTQKAVLRTPTSLIHGFMSLIPGGEQQFQQMQETGIIPNAAARIEALISELGISWPFMRDLFLNIWQSLTIEDVINPIEAFQRITNQFGEQIGRLFSFVTQVVKIVIELILQLMNFPFDIIQRIIANATQAFENIQSDPIGFLKKLLAAVKLGFTKFFDNILQHLLSGVTDWLFTQVRKAGIEPPTEITLASIFDLVVQLLGISMDQIWQKLADRIGQDKVDRIRGAIDKLVGIWNFVRDVQERGVAAIWEYIESQISNLWETVIEQARSWIVTNIIERVTAKLLSMLDPTGIMVVVNSFIAFFNAIQSAVEYLREMLLIVDGYVSTIASVARGDIEPGAARLEQELSNSIPVAIGFLANQVGLGNLAEKLAEIIARIRQIVDKALDWLMDKAVNLGQSLFQSLGLGKRDEEIVGLTDEKVNLHETINLRNEEHEIANRGNSYELTMSSPVTALLNLHPSQEVRDAYEKYLLDISKATSPTGRKKAANRNLPKIIAEIKNHGDPNAPGASAPGIGTIAQHSMQQNRLYKGKIEVWKLESEHVIPRGFINAAFLALGVKSVPGNGRDYKRMHTILIYKGAADLKTEGPLGDTSLISSYKNTLCKIGRELLAVPDAHRNLAKDELVNSVLGLLNEFGADALYATEDAVYEENQKNGAARGPQGEPEPPTPKTEKIKAAFIRQRDDVQEMLQIRLQDLITNRNIDPTQTICK